MLYIRTVVTVLNCPALLRRRHDSGAGYKYPDLLTYCSI